MIAKVILLALFATIALAADCTPTTTYTLTCVQVGGACGALSSTSYGSCNEDTSYCDGKTCVALVARGGDCTSSGSRCAGDLYCSGTGNRTCIAETYVGEGAACNLVTGPSCGRSNNYCNVKTNVCTRQTANGGACDVTNGNQCQFNARCVGTTSTTCQAVGSISVGSNCFGQADLCTAGSYCDAVSGNCKTVATSSNTPCSANGNKNQTACPTGEFCGCPSTTGNYACYVPYSGNVQSEINFENNLGNCLFSSGCDISGSDTGCSACKSQFCAQYKAEHDSDSALAKCIEPEISRILAYCNSAASVAASFAMIFVALLVVM